MPYITFLVPYKGPQVTFDDILNGIEGKRMLELNNPKNTFDTKTIFKVKTPDKLIDWYKIDSVVTALARFCRNHEKLINTPDKKTLYHSFLIPKHSGGMRKIDAPLPPLMGALRELKGIMESICYASYHTSAFAYIRGRNAVDSVRRHQQNQSRWFLKLDFHDFFGSTTPEFVLKQLEQIYPYNLILVSEYGRKYLQEALSLCFLNGGLPQGTPISPMLTNLIMIPIDHRLAKMAREDFKVHMRYTRYADDILISSTIDFRWKEVEDKIVEILNNFGAPFKLNTKKTRFGSSSGANWNLGVMLNEHNEITIGQKRKKYLKAALFSLFSDYMSQKRWNPEDAQVLDGQISYYKMVEKNSIEKIIKTYEEKFKTPYKSALKYALGL